MTILVSFVIGFLSCAFLAYAFVGYRMRRMNDVSQHCWYLERENKQLQGLCLRWQEKRERQR